MKQSKYANKCYAEDAIVNFKVNCDYITTAIMATNGDELFKFNSEEGLNYDNIAKLRDSLSDWLNKN